MLFRSTVKDGVVSMEICDKDNDAQYFTILFTGNIKNECRIQNKSSGKYLKYKNGMLALQDASDLTTDGEYLIFKMS